MPLGPRYMTRFSCIGAACEDTCCHHWKIPLDGERHRALKRAVGGPRAAELVERSSDGKLRLRQKDNGECRLLDEDRLCSLQKEHGEALLPTVCASFPRQVSHVEVDRELAGELSCPELARLCLLSDDGMDLVPVDAALLGRGEARQRIVSHRRDPWLARFVDVRAAGRALLDQVRYPIASRLFFLAFLADRLAPFHFRGGPGDDDRLSRELAALTPELLERLHQSYAAARVTNSPAPSIVLTLLDASARAASLPYALSMASGAVAQHGELLDVAPAERAARDRRLEVAHRARREALPDRVQLRLDHYLTSYCRNSWWKDWFVSSPSLLHHVVGLAARLAILRFLLVGHPDPIAAATPARLDAIAVETTYRFARLLEHNRPFLEVLDTALTKQRLATLPCAVALLQF